MSRPLVSWNWVYSTVYWWQLAPSGEIYGVNAGLVESNGSVVLGG